MTWLPIATAPRDASDFFAGRFFGMAHHSPYAISQYGVGYWHSERSEPRAYDSIGESFEPTHWIPLPPPPENDDER